MNVADCDTAWDNPGDFSVNVVLKVSPDPQINDWQEIARANGSRSAHSGNQVSLSVTAQGRVPQKDRARVLIEIWAEEKDGSRVDGGVYDWQILNYSAERGCWVSETRGRCGANTGAAETFGWSKTGQIRDDVWNPLNSDDEGCEFTLNYGARFSL